jgi:hypothetical protein
VFHPTDVADRGSDEFMGWAGSDMMSSEFMVCDFCGLVVRRGWLVVVVLGGCWECEGGGAMVCTCTECVYGRWVFTAWIGQLVV